MAERAGRLEAETEEGEVQEVMEVALEPVKVDGTAELVVAVGEEVAEAANKAEGARAADLVEGAMVTKVAAMAVVV